MSELKPCPFCGCEMSVEKYKYPNGESEWELFGWHGGRCLFEVAFHIPRCGNKRNLIRAWNRRVE